MNINDLIAIDIHTHAEVSCCQPYDDYGKEFDEAAAKYFKFDKRPTIDETIAYYRERKIGLVMFAVDAEYEMGRHRIPSEEVAEAALKNADIMIAFASVDPHKGTMGVRQARKLIDEYKVKGFKFHPTVQGFLPNDRMAYPLYEVIAEVGLPMLFGTDFPLITPERWMKDFEVAGFRDEVKPLIMKENAVKVLGVGKSVDR